MGYIMGYTLGQSTGWVGTNPKSFGLGLSTFMSCQNLFVSEIGHVYSSLMMFNASKSIGRTFKIFSGLSLCSCAISLAKLLCH